MLKATKLTFAAALLAASCGLAMAQASGAGADKTEGSDAGSGRPALLQSPQATSSPQSNMMQQKKANLNARQKTGRAKDLAGPGQMPQQTK
jgi:hypothetical protein